MTEISDASELLPIFEPLRTVVQLGQDRAEFTTAVPTHTVAEVLSSCFTDTVTHWALPQITGRHRSNSVPRCQPNSS
jgi:hypothetical protein